MKYTQGSWKVVNLKGQYYIVTESDLFLANVDVIQPLSEENEANAHLMAAAPDLLAALKMLWSEPSSLTAADKAYRAIAKAEGKE